MFSKYSAKRIRPPGPPPGPPPSLSDESDEEQSEYGPPKGVKMFILTSLSLCSERVSMKLIYIIMRWLTINFLY